MSHITFIIFTIEAFHIIFERNTERLFLSQGLAESHEVDLTLKGFFILVHFAYNTAGKAAVVNVMLAVP